jgi:hypothetical protein
MPPKVEGELSCRDATGTNTMAETAVIDRPAVTKPVSASALAQHLDLSRTYMASSKPKA